MYDKPTRDGIFNGALASVNKNEKAYHVITTDHKYMIELGLSSFTINELYQWLTRRNKAGVTNSYIFTGSTYNIFGKNSNEIDVYIRGAVEKIFGLQSVYDGKFSPWRKFFNQNQYIGGKYIEPTTVSNWFFEDVNTRQRYSFSGNSIFGKFDNSAIRFGFNGPELYEKATVDGFISNIINMNDWARYTFISKPKQQYTYEDNTIEEFILDIKTSKEKCFTWTNTITFNLNISGTLCSFDEDVTFRLYLYDANKMREDSRRLTTSNPIIIQQNRDMFNRVGSIDDGELTIPDPSNPNDYTPAEIDLYMNRTTGKLESGTPQSIAILKTDIPAAKIPSLQTIENSSIKNLLDPLADNIVNPTGLAYPITVQNGNPQQWSPTYKKSKGCRQAEDNEKFDVVVTNANPVPYSSGQIVMLNRIGGAWIISELYTAKEEVISEQVENKWDFMYLFATYDNYFRNKDFNAVQSDNYHDAILNSYYFNNEEVDYITLVTDKALNYKEDINRIYADVDNSYFQVTSWDFMGPLIGGLRENNALGRTIFNLNEDGSSAENGGEFLWNDDSCVPFFGCCFPDGYNAEQKYAEYMDGSSDINPILIKQYNYFNEPSGGRVFENNNGIKTSVSPGIFSSNINHLPADIALNASPSGIYGSPLKSIKPFDVMTKNTVSKTTIYNSFFQSNNYSQIRNHWISRDSTGFDSFFDFQPINPNKISFKPLRAEIYTTYEGMYQQIDSFGSAAKKQLLVNPNEPIISREAFGRNKLNNLSSNDMYFDALQEESLRYNRFLKRREQFIAYSENANYDPFIWGNSQITIPNGWLDPNGIPAGVVGVIGAEYTLKTGLESIKFTTDNFIGSVSRPIGLGNLLRWEPTCGTPSDPYWQFNTTQLFAKVYHSWPREQTIYDPRFFTVFHFNEGLNLINDYRYVKKLWHVANEVFLEEPNNFPQIGNHNEEYYIEYVKESDVDLRVPTLANGDRVAKDAIVYADGALINGTIQPIHSNTDLWFIDPRRRGKMLPYTYSFRTIGIDITRYNPEDKSGSIYIETNGFGYSSSDRFTVTGGSGSGVILKPIVDNSTGRIFGFEIVNPGNGFLPSDFLEENHSSIIDTKLTITPINSTGQNLKAYVARGKIVDNVDTDIKPKLATSESEIRLTPLIKTGPSDTIAGANAISNEVVVTEAKIFNKNITDYKYDIFFHFHNDISHTFYMDRWSAGLPTYDQNVTVEITTG